MIAPFVIYRLKRHVAHLPRTCSLSPLKLPATSCGESPTVKESIFCIRSLTTPQAAGNALAVQFNAVRPFCLACFRIFVVTVLFLALVSFQSAYATDDISGTAHLTYSSAKTTTGEEKDRSWSFAQTYNLKATKDFSPKFSFIGNLGINVQETNKQKTTRLTPDLRLNMTNEYFTANTGYQLTEKGLDIFTMTSDEQRLTNESWNANFKTKSEKYPKIRLNYNEDSSYDHLTVHTKDTKTRKFAGGTDYTYRFLDFDYEYKNVLTDDYVAEEEDETGTNYGKVNFRKSFLANKITSSGSYSINDTRREVKTGGQTVRVAEIKTVSQGLYVQDTTPLSSTLISVPDLINGDKGTAALSAGNPINIGGGIPNTNQNIGVDLTSATEVELIYLYTRPPSPFFNKDLYTWAVYYSSDNLSWTQITSNATKDYDTTENRFEISFTATTARYFKIVNTANDTFQLNVTEIEAYSYTTYPAFSTTRTERTTQTILANLGYKPTDWLSLVYDFTQIEEDAKTDKTRRQTHNANIRVERELHKYLTAWAQYGRRMEYDSGATAEDKTTDTYLLHFLSSPLTTLNTDLSLNHTVSKEDGQTKSRNSSALFQISAKLREGADLDINGNIIRSEDLTSQSETNTKSIDSNLRLELTKMLTAELEYSREWTDTQQPSGDTTSQTSDAKTTVYWRPSRDFYFRGSYDIEKDAAGQRTTRHQHNLSWIMTEKMQLSMNYTLARNNAINTTYSSYLTWNLSKIITMRFSYAWSRQKTDTITDTQTFTTNLSARF
jgi:hypothetical protein